MSTGTTGTVAWVLVTSDDLYSRMAGPQFDAVKSAALASSQDETSVFTAVMTDVVARIRQYIASNPRNRLSQTENSVPPELKDQTIWLILQQMMARLNIALDLKDTQKELIRQANEDLDRLRNIQPPYLLVGNPVDPEGNPAMQLGYPTTVVSSTTRKMTRTTLSAL